MEDLGDVEVVVGYFGVKVVFVAAEFLHFFLGRIVGSKRRKRVDKLTRDCAADLHVVAHGGVVGCGSREWHTSCGVQAFDADDRVALGGEAEHAEEAVDFFAGICGPDGDVIAGLIGE